MWVTVEAELGSVRLNFPRPESGTRAHTTTRGGPGGAQGGRGGGGLASLGSTLCITWRTACGTMPLYGHGMLAHGCVMRATVSKMHHHSPLLYALAQ